MTHAQPITRLYTLHALTPLHAGTGQGVGDIDLPIARERATTLPYVPGSSVRGVLRDALNGQPAQAAVFGPDSAHASDHAGALSVTDARLLLFPIRSVAGTWAWATSPTLLGRLKRDLAATGQRLDLAVPSFKPEDGARAVVTTGSLLRVGQTEHVVLDDWQLPAAGGADAWATALGSLLGDEELTEVLRGHLCLLPDTVLCLAAEMATEVSARIRLNDHTKTVERGALWYEEALPAESVLFGLIRAERSHKNDLDLTPAEVLGTLGTERYAQFGGKAGTGRGLCHWRAQ
jgi:CRISPR-associated protein Cmr4